MKKSAVVLCVLCSLALAGCARSRSVLYGGVSLGIAGKRTVITDAAAVRDGRQIRREWLAAVAHLSPPGKDFPNRTRAEILRRLHVEAARYHFAVETVQLRHSGQVAPLVLLRTDRYVALARAIPAIERSLDPHIGRSDLAGWRFAAFYLEAQDERGVPFVVVTNVVQRGSVGGGQWARSDGLFPFGHV